MVDTRASAAPSRASSVVTRGGVPLDDGVVPAGPTIRRSADPNSAANLARAEASAAPITVIVRLSDPPLVVTQRQGGVRSTAQPGGGVDTSSAAARTYLNTLTVRQDALRDTVRRVAPSAREVARYNLLLNAVALTVPGSSLRAIRRLPGVTGIWLSKTYVPTLDQSVQLIDVPALWNSPLIGGPANAGVGIKIAVIDSGIEITSTMFNPAGYTAPGGFPRCDMPSNCAYTSSKVIVAKAYPRGAGLSAQDDVGHGTAVASIAAGELTTADSAGLALRGVASAAYLMNYNVFPSGAASSADTTILQAVQDAVADGANVINLSLGGPASDLGLDPLEQAVSAAGQAGVVVAISAGNTGPGASTVGSPGQAPDVISSGATTNAHTIIEGPTVALTTSASYTATVPATLTNILSQNSSVLVTQTIAAPLALAPINPASTAAGDAQRDGCAAFNPGSMAGAIALISRGSCTFVTKITNAAAAGAIAVVIFDNRSEPPISMATAGTTIPSVMISQSDGVNLVDYTLAISPAVPNLVLSLPYRQGSFATRPNVLTTFSSTGPAPGNAIKPDVVAPGQGIYSAAQDQKPGGELYDPSGFISWAGTSASSPHTAGVAVLLRQVHPEWSPAQIKAALMNTANNSVVLDPTGAATATVQQQGAGLIDAYAAATTPLLAQPGSISLGQVNESDGAPITTSAVITLTNVSTQTQTIAVGVQPATLAPGLTASFSANSVTLAPGGSAAVTGTVVVSGATPGQYDANVVFTTANNVSIHVPVYLVVTNVAVTPGSVLLVDDYSAFIRGPDGDVHGIARDVPNYADSYTTTLTTLGIPYTLWDEAQLGSPALSDLQRAAAVIYYTGANQGQHELQGSPPAVSASDQTILDQYVASGGKLFITGSGVGSAPGANPDFLRQVLHTDVLANSIYDGPGSQPLQPGLFGASPPSPSMTGLPGDPIAAGLIVDINATNGDGFGVCCIDNITVVDTVGGTGAGPVGGVSELRPINGTASFTDTLQTITGTATGLFIVPPDVQGVTTGIVATKDSPEPRLEAPASGAGRTVYFGFGFEGINEPGSGPTVSTTVASRETVMSHVLGWLSDAITPTLALSGATAGVPVTGTIALASTNLVPGVTAAVSTTRWDFGDGTPIASASGPSLAHTYAAPGVYTVRVEVTDNLGHSAITTGSVTVTAATATNTPQATATETVVVGAATATGTPLPETTTATSSVPDTATSTPPATATGTSQPAATNTATTPPQPTETPIVVGFTATPVPATATSVPPTATSSASSATAIPATATGVVATGTATTAPANTATATMTAQSTATTMSTTEATGTPEATETSAATATVISEVIVRNKPATVKGGRTTPCGLIANLIKLQKGCEIISSISRPGARVTYTLVYPARSGLRQVFVDRADRRGHSLHVFNVPYTPPVGARHGSPPTVVRVTVSATLPNGSKLRSGDTRFVVVR